MKSIKLLDCTLRDGGYINSWNFGFEKIKRILNKLNLSNMDIIECGFITGKEYNKDFSLYENANDVNALLQVNNKKAMHVAMIAIGEKEIDPKLLCDKEESYIDGIRLTFHENEIEKAVDYGKTIMAKGYKLFMQPVGTTLYSDKKLIELIEIINQLKPYAFYLVDTLGTLFPNDIERFMYLIDTNLSENICLGFHSHNNLQLSFSNAQRMIGFNTKREMIIDCSVFGMGRGAGNLCSEMICEYLNNQCDHKYHIMPLLEIIDEDLMPIFAETPWGYSASYFLSAINQCHPNYSSFLLSKQTIPVQTIGELLKLIPDKDKGLFKKSLIEEIYLDYQKNTIDDADAVTKLKEIIEGRDVLILGSGTSLKNNKNDINSYISDYNPFVIAINFLPADIKTDMIFISNIKRYEKYINQIPKEKLILTSNIKDAGDNMLIVNYSKLLNSSEYVSDNAGLMLIKLLTKLFVNNILIAGMDGFNKNLANNYIDSELIGTTDPDQVEIKNEEMKRVIMQLTKTVNCKFITPSKYQ